MSTQSEEKINKNPLFNALGNDDVAVRTIIKGSTT